MTTSPNDTNGEKKEKPQVKTPPTDEEMFYGIVDTRSSEEKSGREEVVQKEEKVPDVVAPKTTKVEQQSLSPPTANGVQSSATPANGTPNARNDDSAAPPNLPVAYPSNLKPGIPTRLEEIMDLVGEGKTIWDALAAVFGLHEANYKYLILERTRLTKEEANMVSDAIFVAEHGIGTEPFDFPIPEFADWVVSRLHAFISVDMGHGNARDEFREITSTWVASLKAKAAMSASGEQFSEGDRGMMPSRNP